MAGCNAVAVRSSRRSDVYLWRCGRECACMLIHRSLLRKCFYSRITFSWLVSNYPNSEIFPIYGSDVYIRQVPLCQECTPRLQSPYKL